MRHGTFHTLSFNLRKCRAALFTHYYDREHDQEKMVDQFQKTLDRTTRAATQLLLAGDGECRPDRMLGRSICEVYPAVDVRIFDEIHRLYSDLRRLDDIYTQPQKMLDLMQRATTTFETMIREYRKEYPL